MLTELRDELSDTLNNLEKVADRDNRFLLEEERRPRMTNVRKQRRMKEGRKEIEDKLENKEGTRRSNIVSKLKNLLTETTDSRG